MDAPNVVPVFPHLLTAGQPSVADLQALAAQGFEVVVNLDAVWSPNETWAAFIDRVLAERAGRG